DRVVVEREVRPHRPEGDPAAADQAGARRIAQAVDLEGGVASEATLRLVEHFHATHDAVVTLEVVGARERARRQMLAHVQVLARAVAIEYAHLGDGDAIAKGSEAQGVEAPLLATDMKNVAVGVEADGLLAEQDPLIRLGRNGS